MSDSKTCGTCKVSKPRSEFHKRAASNDGLTSVCKSCRKKYEKEYNLNNREKLSLRYKKYYEENKEKISQYNKKRYEENREKVSALVSAYYQKNKEKILQKRQENKDFFNKKSNDYYHNNKEKCAERHKQWSKLNRAKRTARQNERYTSQKKRTPVWLTDADKNEMEKFYERAAQLSTSTGIKHHVDHIIPLQGKTVSGLHVPQNLQVLNHIENIRKKNKYEEWNSDA